MLKRAMISTSQMYNVSFQRLLEVMEIFSKDIFEGVQAVICDPPYITHWIVELSNSEHDC